jgi:hypothetical protein
MKKLLPFLILGGILLGGCKSGTEESTQTTPPAEQPAAAAPATPTEEPAKASLRAFLTDIDGTYGWETKDDDISLDFFPDGRLHIQGPDGEATMWQGSWWFEGDKLGMDRVDLGKKVYVTAKQDGDNLLLDGVVYTRYRPVGL